MDSTRQHCHCRQTDTKDSTKERSREDIWTISDDLTKMCNYLMAVKPVWLYRPINKQPEVCDMWSWKIAKTWITKM